jgi:DNA-binding LacI/PurR family transcriptional regulator
LFFAAQQFLTRQRLSVPDDVSMMAFDDHPAFGWFEPIVTHLYIDSSSWVRPVMDWVGKVARGSNDRRETLIKAQLFKGGTIGPAPEEK